MPDNIHVVSQWRGVHELSPYERVKVPTKIAYDPDGKITWGYEVPDDADAIEWFKLLLVKNSDLPEQLQNSANTQVPREKLKALGKTTKDVISDYCKSSMGGL